MKKRTLILCGCAVVFATASAFTSKRLTPTAVWFEGRTQSNPTVVQCLPTDKTCDHPGAFRCKVTIVTTSGSVLTNGRMGPTEQCALLSTTSDLNPIYNPSEPIVSVTPYIP